MQNKVELMGYYGGDKTHCLSAWASTFEELDLELPQNIEDRVDFIFQHVCEKKLKTPQELLKMLADNEHGTPFECSFLHFQTTEDIASHIHFIKHRHLQKNSESARYKELKEDNIYIPKDWEGITSDEDMDITMYGVYHDPIIIDSGIEWSSILRSYAELGNHLYHECLRDLEPVLGRKRAKESARYFKTYNSQLNTTTSMNFRAFMHFQHLRNSPHAQVEIREMAQMMLECVKSIPNNPFEYSLKAFGY